MTTLDLFAELAITYIDFAFLALILKGKLSKPNICSSIAYLLCVLLLTSATPTTSGVVSLVVILIYLFYFIAIEKHHTIESIISAALFMAGVLLFQIIFILIWDSKFVYILVYAMLVIAFYIFMRSTSQKYSVSTLVARVKRKTRGGEFSKVTVLQTIAIGTILGYTIFMNIQEGLQLLNSGEMSHNVWKRIFLDVLTTATIISLIIYIKVNKIDKQYKEQLELEKTVLLKTYKPMLNEINAFWHNISNIIHVVNYQNSDKEKIELLDELAHLVGNTKIKQKYGIINISNKLVSNILASYIPKSQEQGVELIVVSSDFGKLDVSNIHLIEILSTLLDNAIEFSQSVSGVVDVSINRVDGNVIFNIYNEMRKDSEGNSIKSKSSNKIGLNRVSKLCEINEIEIDTVETDFGEGVYSYNTKLKIKEAR